MEAHDPNFYPTMLEGVSRGFLSQFLDLGARSVKKWHFERQNLRTDSKNLAKHPPKWWSRHLGIKPILKNLIFSIVFDPFSPLKRPKSKNGWQIFVYRSIILKKKKIGGSPHLFAPLVKRHKLNIKKTSVFWDTLM